MRVRDWLIISLLPMVILVPKIPDWFMLIILPLSPVIVLFLTTVGGSIYHHRRIDKLPMRERILVGYVTTGLDRHGNITYRKRY